MEPSSSLRMLTYADAIHLEYRSVRDRRLGSLNACLAVCSPPAASTRNILRPTKVSLKLEVKLVVKLVVQSLTHSLRRRVSESPVRKRERSNMLTYAVVR